MRLLLWERGSRGVFEEKANTVNVRVNNSPLKMIAHDPCLSVFLFD